MNTEQAGHLIDALVKLSCGQDATLDIAALARHLNVPVPEGQTPLVTFGPITVQGDGSTGNAA